MERWHLKKASECCSEHKVVAEARETEPFWGVRGCLCCRDRGQSGWMGSLLRWAITLLYPGAQQRPLATWEWGHRLSDILDFEAEKSLRNLPASQEQGRAESWKQRCTSLALCVLRPLLQCLPAAGAFPSTVQRHQVTQETSPADTATAWSSHWQQIKQPASQSISLQHNHSLILWRPSFYSL